MFYCRDPVSQLRNLDLNQARSVATVGAPFEPSNRRRETRAERKKRRREISQTYWAREQAVIESSVASAHRLDLLRKYGSFSLAYSTAVQPLLNYWGDEHGYLAYRQRWGQTFVLADPVAPTDRRQSLVKSFIQSFRKPTFVQVSHDVARYLNTQGYYANEMGVDTELDLEQFDFSGRQREWLRYADNWTQRRGFCVVQGPPSRWRDDIENVSENWRQTRTIKRKEVRFLNRPIVLDDETDVRHFYLFDENRVMQAFVFFDPLYQANELVGYVASFKRRTKGAPIYADAAIMKRAIEAFQSEGRQVLRLGLSPLASVEGQPIKHNGWLHRELQYLHRAWWVNKYFYNYVGHASYKSRFRGHTQPVYFCSPVRCNYWRLFTLSSLCGFF